jgi:hypothetical protein
MSTLIEPSVQSQALEPAATHLSGRGPSLSFLGPIGQIRHAIIDLELHGKNPSCRGRWGWRHAGGAEAAWAWPSSRDAA